MPASYRIDPQRRLVVSIFQGTLTDPELWEHVESLRLDAKFDSNFGQFIDCSAITELEVSARLIQRIATERLGPARAKWAILAPQDSIFGVARMFQIQYNESLVEVFRDRDAARQWFVAAKRASCMNAR